MQDLIDQLHQALGPYSARNEAKALSTCPQLCEGLGMRWLSVGPAGAPHTRHSSQDSPAGPVQAPTPPTPLADRPIDPKGFPDAILASA